MATEESQKKDRQGVGHGSVRSGGDGGNIVKKSARTEVLIR